MLGLDPSAASLGLRCKDQLSAHAVVGPFVRPLSSLVTRPGLSPDWPSSAPVLPSANHELVWLREYRGSSHKSSTSWSFSDGVRSKIEVLVGFT